jgi:hypothetical protein
MMQGNIEYVVNFANGESERCNTLEAAENVVMQRTGYDQAPPDLLPAEILEIGPNDVGNGRVLRRYPG